MKNKNKGIPVTSNGNWCWVYFLKSNRDNWIYIGFSSDGAGVGGVGVNPAPQGGAG